MRRALGILAGLLVVAMAMPAWGELCADCKGGSYTKDLETCAECKTGVTTSGEFKLCPQCSSKLGQCEHCRKALASAKTQPATQSATQPATQTVDLNVDGRYVKGPWEYRFKTTLKGTRSEGYHGELLYQGKPVAEPEAINDYYQTPWGPVYWEGRPGVIYGPHGWMAKRWLGDKAGKALPEPVGDDVTQPGQYRAGQWEYILALTSAGTKSEGTTGRLFFNGRPVEEPARGDYYRTPWGEMAWLGMPPVQWGAHGWVLRSPQAKGGRALAEPWIEAGGPVVMAMVVTEEKRTPQSQETDAWVKEELEKQGVKAFRVEQDWFPICDQAATLHDTRMYGLLKVRVLPARDAETLTVQFDGSQAGRVDLPRKDGARQMVVRTLASGMGTAKFFVALRVERAAAAWPKPLEIGAESDGKEVAVKGVKEVVIRLAGDKDSGLVWTLKSVQGDGIGTASVKAWGNPQFTPETGAAAGTTRKGDFENTLRVVGTGKSFVELELKRPWQEGVAAEKTYKVTLDVQELGAAR